VVGPVRFAELQQASEGGVSGLQAYFERYHVDILLLSHNVYSRELVPRLQARGWVLVHLDDTYYGMVPKRPAFEALIAREGYHHIAPWDNAPVTPGNARRVLEEANRSLYYCHERASFAWAYRARSLATLGRHKEALEARLKIPERMVIE
jgi:hypothetical protein